MSRTRAEQVKALEEWADRVDAAELRRADTEALREIAALAKRRADVDEDLTAAVRSARWAQRSWSEIGAMLGVSKQAAHRKYAWVVDGPSRVNDEPGGKKMDLTPAKSAPCEFVVEGPAVSPQAGDKARLDRWREKVKEAARDRWNADPLPIYSTIGLTIIYFSNRGPGEARDPDNLAKPIMDAMKGIIYCDDAQVWDLLCRIRDFETCQVNPSADLKEYLRESRPVVHVSVDPAPSSTVMF